MSKEAVTYNDIVEFIQNFNSDGECPTCKSASWFLVGAKNDENSLENVELLISKTSSLQPPAHGTISTNSSIPCYALMCHNCGHTKIYNKYAVELWKGKRKSEKDIE